MSGSHVSIPDSDSTHRAATPGPAEAALSERVALLEAELERTRRALSATDGELQRTRETLDALERSAGMRIVSALKRLPGVYGTYLALKHRRRPNAPSAQPSAPTPPAAGLPPPPRPAASGAPNAAPAESGGLDVEQVNALWGQRAKELLSNFEGVQRKHWMSHPTLAACINRAISGDPAVSHVQLIKRDFRAPFARGLILGCGSGGLERELLVHGVLLECDAYDISRDAIAAAQAAAAKAGLAEKIHYRVADLNRAPLPEGSYDAVFASMSLHHVEGLEHLFGQVARALKPGGYLFVNDYVGPPRFQFPDKVVALINRLLETLPVAYKTTVEDGRLKSSFVREKPENVIAVDPTEAVRSDQTLALAAQHLEPVLRRDYGGTLLEFGLADIVGNFLPDRPGDRVALELLYLLERVLIEEGIIPSNFAFAVFRKPLRS